MGTYVALFEVLARYFSNTAHAQLAQHILQRAREHDLASLQPVTQHGDFVLNNLAITDKHLVIFDWEDYGKIILPGLDICTLAMSALEGNLAIMRALAHESQPSLDAGIDAFLRKACTLSGIEFNLFRRLVPLHMLTFLYMKRNYGEPVKQRISHLLQQVAA